ncbi:MAG: serine hydrolase, partial [bacterium]|nr:serine hydrolase [bacterium]
LEDPYITRHLTIRDILSHRTGFGTFDGDLLWYRTDYGNEEIIRRMQYLPITKRFRDEFGYQNNMYITAGEVVRKVSGLTWGEFLKRKILEPLEMKTSRACSQLLEKGMNVARPHVEGKTYPFYVQRSNAAASIYSSIDEMSNWMRMLLNGGKWKDRQILKPGTVEMLFTPQMVFPTSPFMKKNGTHFRTYALGWGAWDYYGNKVVEHSGGMPGYISRVTLVPGKKLGIVILTNNLNGAASPLRYKILDLFLTGKQTDWKKTFLEMQEKQEKRGKERKAKREKERVKGTRSSLELGKYAGQYEDRVYGKAEILMEQETLTLTLLPSKDVFTSKMEHWHFDTFRIRFKDAFLPDGFVTFEFDSNGAVTGFKIDLPNPDFHFHHLHFKKN